MQVTMGLITVLLLYSCGFIMTIVSGQRYADYPMPPQTTVISRLAYRDRRAKAEPTCDELRAMWRYSKRQSRAAESTNDLPMYRDPFSYNIWETYPIRSQSPYGYRDTEEQARNRGGGRAPVYGKMVHKAPAEGRLRNGKIPNRMKAFEEVARMYGTVNRQPADQRRRQYSFRVGGGTSISDVPQAGSFQHLKDLIRTERARELQDQRIAEEIAARSAALGKLDKNDRHSDTESRRLSPNSVQSYQEPKNVNYNFPVGQYVSSLTSLNDGLLRSDDYERDSIIRQ